MSRWNATSRGQNALLVVVAVVTGACGGGGGTSQPPLTGAAARGEELVELRGCLSCHSTDGSRGTGPTWKGLAGSDVRLAGGRTATADDAYLRRSILDPDAETVDGFPTGLMASTIRGGSLSEDEADAIVAYLRTLGNSSRRSGDY